MKFSSQLALGALIGRSIGRKWAKDNGMDADLSWKDAVLAAVIAKNEAIDKDGEIRTRIENGVSNREIEALERMRDEELRESMRRQENAQKPKKLSVFQCFVKGLKGERI